MTAQTVLETGDSVLTGDSVSRRIWVICQALLVAWVCVAFLADFFAKSMFVLVLAAVSVPIALLLLLVAVVIALWRERGLRRWGRVTLLLTLPLIAGSVFLTSWPMRLSFAASTSSLDRLAEQVAAGQTPPLPTRAGAYLIRAVETRAVKDGTAVCLWTTPNPVRQHVGFVQSPVGVTPPFNPWTHVQMNPKWHYFGAD